MLHGKTAIGDKIVQYRWPLGIFLWAVCTALQLHGSSIGIFAQMLGEPNLNTAFFGLNRAVQIDDWGVLTPFIFSQYYDVGYGTFSAISHIVRAAPTDVSLVYGVPCWNIITLFRPFYWGYLFLPVGNGLAFFWMGRLIILFLASYEMGLVLTDKQKGLSFGYACLIAFSQMVQIWFSENSFMEMLIAGQLAVVFLNGYIQTLSYKRRALYALGIAYCLAMYLVVLYPAWQISFGYVFLFLVLWILYRNKSQGMLTAKDGGIFLVVLVFSALLLAAICTQSWDTIQAFVQSEYPGHRQLTGGTLLWCHVFGDPFIYLSPLKILNAWSVLDDTTFLTFAPFGLLLFGWQYLKRKTWDGLALALVVFIVIGSTFSCMEWPAFLAKATLLFAVPEKRLLQAISFAQVLLLIRMLSLEKDCFNIRATAVLAVLAVSIDALFAVPLLTNFQALDKALLVLCMCLLAVFILCRFRRAVPLYFFVISILTGMLMNPLAQGTGSIYRTELGQQMQKIVSTDTDKWIVDSDDKQDLAIHAFNNYPLFFGHPTINSSNMYVDWERWDKFPLTEAQRKIVNRSCYMNMYLTQGPTEFQCPNEDLMVANVVNIRMNVDDLQKLGATHILTHRDLTFLSTEHVVLTLAAHGDDCNIYDVTYR